MSSPLFRVVDEDLSAGSALLAPRGDEERAQSSREESRLRAEARRLRAHLLIVVGVLLPDDLEDAWARGSRVVWRCMSVVTWWLDERSKLSPAEANAIFRRLTLPAIL